MRIVVCVKEVLDPDAVNNYAIAGRLEIGEDGKTLTQTAIPRLMNGFDEQAIEAALRLRDAGADCTIVRGLGGPGSDEAPQARGRPGRRRDGRDSSRSGDARPPRDGLAADGLVRSSGGADLVLCGRQASDDDQGVVSALIGERWACRS